MAGSSDDPNHLALCLWSLTTGIAKPTLFAGSNAGPASAAPGRTTSSQSHPSVSAALWTSAVLSEERSISMFARIVELFPKLEKKEEFLKIVRTDVMPILRKQPGFLEALPFTPVVENERMVVVTLWANKSDADRYVREIFPKVSD